MQALVLAAGRGEGLLPYTLAVQKEAIRVTGRAIISFPIIGLKSAGINEFVIVVNERGNQIEEILNELSVPYELVRQKTPGIEGAIKDGLAKIDEDKYVLAFGDIVAPEGFYSGLISAMTSGKDAVISLVPVIKGKETYGTVTIEGGEIKVGGSTLALGGAYVLPRVEFDNIYSFIENLSKQSRVEFFVWGGTWVDIGYPEDLIFAIRELLEGKDSVVKRGAKVKGNAIIEQSIIEDDAEIEDFAVIKRSYIGRGAYVGNFALVRDYSSVEEGATIGAYVEVAHSLVGRRARVNSKAYLSYSVIGDGAEIGANVITTSYPGRPVRGYESKIGALISPGVKVEHGKVLPPGYKA